MDEENQDSIKGKIMNSSVIILFLACFTIVLFHVYSRWCLRRSHSHRLHRFTTPSPPPPYAVTPQGLDLRAVNSLPTFIYESENHETPLECAVCLSEFQNGETGRILPDCKHCFHIDCVDTWLQSRRDCPLCRTRVKGRPVGNLVSIFLLDGSGRGSGRDPTCSPSTPSSSQDLDATTESTGPDSEPDQDPNELLGRALNPDPGYRVTRFWL